MRELPLQFIRIGNLAIAAFPGELSTATGVMVRSQLQPLLPKDAPLLIVGLANEYTNYVATPDEYGAQDYMAASTIWGPYEAAVFACTMSQLAGQPLEKYPVTMSSERKTYRPGPKPEHIVPKMSFGAPAVGDERAAPEDELDKILLLHNGAPARDLHFVEWQETVNDSMDEFAAASRRTVRMQIEINGTWVRRPVASGSTIIDDDSGVGFVTMLRHSPSEAERTVRAWRAFWIRPLLEKALPPGRYRFEVETRDALNVVTVCHSGPFTLTDAEGRPPALACTP
jgi:hypothetical protein